ILSADSIRSARLKALWGIGLLFFNFILYIGLLFVNFIQDIWQNIGHIIIIVSFVLYSMAIYSVSKAAASKSLFINYIISVIISFLGIFFVYMLAPSGASDMNAVLSLGTMIALILAIYLYKIHDELAGLSGSSLFLWAFWIFVVSVPFCFLLIMSLGFFVFFLPGFVGLIMAWVLLFIAWWRFGKVEKR
ncbi:hypothetical protein, partial [Campylobacter sp.]